MNKTDKKLRRQIALSQYKEKWGLAGYTPVLHYNELHLYKSGVAIPSYLCEIKSLDTLLYRLKHSGADKRYHSTGKITVHETDGTEITFDTADELFHYTLIKKISGV